jgi:hypothetical protein
VDAASIYHPSYAAKDAATDNTTKSSSTLVDASVLTNLFSLGSRGSAKLADTKTTELDRIDDTSGTSSSSRYTDKMQPSTKITSKRRKQSVPKNNQVADSSSESTSRISVAFAKKNQKRALYESTHDEDSFELNMNLFDDSSYSYTNVHSLYSSKSSKPHSEAPYAKQVCVLSCE